MTAQTSLSSASVSIISVVDDCVLIDLPVLCFVWVFFFPKQYTVLYCFKDSQSVRGGCILSSTPPECSRASTEDFWHAFPLAISSSYPTDSQPGCHGTLVCYIRSAMGNFLPNLSENDSSVHTNISKSSFAGEIVTARKRASMTWQKGLLDPLLQLTQNKSWLPANKSAWCPRVIQ